MSVETAAGTSSIQAGLSIVPDRGFQYIFHFQAKHSCSVLLQARIQLSHLVPLFLEESSF